MTIRKLMFFLFKKLFKLLFGGWVIKLAHLFPVAFRQAGYNSLRFLYVHLRPKEPITIELQGNKMQLRPQGDTSFFELWVDLRKKYEAGTTELFKKEVKQGMNVVDLGAHIGYFTLLAARLVGEKGRVFAFEPAPDNFALLTKNIATNGYKNVVPIQKAVSNKIGQVKLILLDSGTHYTCYSGGKEEFITVESLTLDEFIKEKKLPIDFIKMDIEGGEMAALNGMSNLIKKNKNLKIVTEFCPYYLRRAGSSPEEFLYKLVAYGFKLHVIDENEKSIDQADATSLLQACLDNKIIFTNLFCVREK